MTDIFFVHGEGNDYVKPNGAGRYFTFKCAFEDSGFEDSAVGLKGGSGHKHSVFLRKLEKDDVVFYDHCTCISLFLIQK